jgi:4-diphosphocytidyl-2-C-methyl-D-erythritol kinase
MRISAPAKINLHLRVGKRRDDGFHPLLTWMCTIGLFDNLTFVRRQIRQDEAANEKALGAFDFSLQCDRPDLPVDGRNLVVRVAAALADTLSRVGKDPAGPRERVSAFLNKRIPVGAGLAGGSSDAAATLKALAAMWKLDWDAGRMADFAAQFGSDVPFFFHGPSSVCSGRGEIVQPIAPPAVKYAVLVMPAKEISTAEAYRRFDEMGLGHDDAIAQEPPWHEWTKLPADELMPRLENDLERPAFAMKPELDELRKSLGSRWNKIVRMSGSGSSLFTLCDDEENANALATAAQQELRVPAMTVRIGI